MAYGSAVFLTILTLGMHRSRGGELYPRAAEKI